MKLSDTFVVAAALGSCLAQETSALMTQLERRDNVNRCTRITPPPADTYCGQTARVVDPLLYTGFNQTLDYNTCQKFCLDMNSPPPLRLGCGTFAHDSKTNLCTYFQQSVGPIDDPYTSLQLDPNSTESFVDATCFSCNRNCNLPSTFNIINNPRFDLSQTQLAPWQGLSATIVPSSGEGNMVLLKANSKNYVQEPFLGQYISLCPDTDYQLSFDYKFVKGPMFNASSTGSLLLKVGDCSPEIQSFPHDALLGSWQTFTCSFHRTGDNSQENYAPTIVLQSFSGEIFHMYVKNFRMSQIDPPVTAKTKGQSFISNGGFETGSIKPWKAKGNMQNQTFQVIKPGLAKLPGVPASKHSFRFFGIGKRDGYYFEAGGGVTLSQTTNNTIKRGHRYVATVEYRAFHLVSGASMAIGTFFNFHDGAGQFPLTDDSNMTRSFSRIFTGLESGRDVFSLGWGTRTETLPPGNLTVFVDNLDIRELA